MKRLVLLLLASTSSVTCMSWFKKQPPQTPTTSHQSAQQPVAGKPVAKQPVVLQPTPQVTAAASGDHYDEIIYNWSSTMAEAFEAIKNKYYVKDIDLQKAMAKAINYFVSLDPHSSFLDPKSYKDILESTSGEFFGIGVIIAGKGTEDEFLATLDTIPEGPSDKAGIKAGDKIIEIDGTALRGLTTEEVTTKLKGPRNSVVTVKVLREGYPEPMSFNITRDVVKEQSSQLYYFKDFNVYYLRLITFSTNAVKQLEALLKKSQKQPYSGLILDLRNNAGGLLGATVDIAGLFLEKGSLVVTTKDRNNKVIERYATARDPIASANAPIFILTNNYTASAAEILAGCLKIHSDQQAQKNKTQHAPVFLMGTRTFGKGSVQEIIPVSNDSAIRLTTALYFLPDDVTIQGIGIEPDIEAERKFPPPAQVQWLNQFYGRESALKNSIKVKPEEPKKPSPKEEKKNLQQQRLQALASDSQIHDTLTCINLLHLNKQSWHNRIDALKLMKSTVVANEKLTLEEVTL